MLAGEWATPPSHQSKRATDLKALVTLWALAYTMELHSMHYYFEHHDRVSEEGEEGSVRRGKKERERAIEQDEIIMASLGS